MCLFATHVSFLLPILKIQMFVLITLSFETSLQILGT